MVKDKPTWYIVFSIILVAQRLTIQQLHFTTLTCYNCFSCTKISFTNGSYPEIYINLSNSKVQQFVSCSIIMTVKVAIKGPIKDLFHWLISLCPSPKIGSLDPCYTCVIHFMFHQPNWLLFYRSISRIKLYAKNLFDWSYTEIHLWLKCVYAIFFPFLEYPAYYSNIGLFIHRNSYHSCNRI